MPPKRTIKEVEAAMEELESQKKRLQVELDGLCEGKTAEVDLVLNDIKSQPDCKITIVGKTVVDYNATSCLQFGRDWKQTVLVSATLKNHCTLYFGVCAVHPPAPDRMTVYFEHPDCSGFLGKIRQFEEWEYYTKCSDPPQPVKDCDKVMAFHDRWDKAAELVGLDYAAFRAIVIDFAKTCDRLSETFNEYLQDDSTYEGTYGKFQMHWLKQHKKDVHEWT